MVATPTATAQTGQEPVSTREQYDGNGRLIAVEEPSAPSGTAVRTEYDYDVGGRLTKASTGVQLRTFVYDAAGLLAAEHHPESGDTTYRYDARGHVVDKKIGTTVHLQFTYDAAERLTKVFDALSSRALKTLAYDSVPELTPSLPAHSEPGALLRQTRVNVLPDALGQYDVTDDFRYDDAGRPASKTTLVATSGAGSHTFQQTYTYTGLGSPAAANFPLCLTPCGALALTPRNIPLTYDNGFLTAVDGVTGSLEPDDGGPAGISYTPAGTVWRVKHAQGNGTGVVDKYDTNLVTNLPRIASIEFSGTRECDLITNEMPSDTLIRAGTPATLSVTASPGAVITWYKGRRGDASQTVGTGAAVTVSPAADTEYWARASLTGATCSDSTSTLTVRVCKPVAILSAFQNDVGRVNERKVFSVAAEGVNLSFAWSAYKCQDGNCTGTSVSLGTGPTVEWVPTVAATYKIRVTVTSEFCESSASAEFNVVVEAQLPDCTAKWSAPLDDKTFVLAPGDGVLLRVALQAIPNASKYQFIWYENGVVAKTDPPVSNTSPTTDPPANPPVSNTSTFELFVGSKDKVVSVDAYVQCGDNTKSATLRSTTFATDLSRCARPAVTVAPLSVALSADRQTAQIAVVSEEPRLKYQWYRGESGNTSRPVSSATFAALMVPFAADTYWVRVTAECGAFTDSPTVVVSTENCGPVRLLQEPQEQTVTARTPVQLSVDASSTPGGGPLNPLQWFANGVETGATGFAYTVRPLRTTDYKVAVSNSCHTTWSRVARIHVTSCSEIEIIRQPADVIMAEPVSVTLTVAAAQSGVIYQWYSGESGDVTMPIANGTGPSLLVPPGTAPAAIRKFWARVSFGDPNRCAVDSRTALVKVCPPLSVAGVADPTATVELRSTAPLLRQVLDANVQGVDLSYEWFSGTAVVENKRLAATTSYLPVRPAETENFCVRVTSGCTSEQLLRKFRVSVCGTIGVPEADRTVVMRGSNVHLSVNTTNADKVEWFSSQPDGSDVSFVGLGNVVDAVVTERRAFWARASNGTCSVESTRIEVKLCIPPKITWSMNIATQVQSDVTQTLSFDIAEPLDWTSGNSPAPDNTHTTSWYEGRSGDVSKPLSTQESFVVHPAATTWYWVRVITPKGCFTNLEIKIEVCRPLIASQPATRTIIDKIANPAASALLAVVANGGPLTYDWYVGQSGDTSNPVLNQHSDKLTVSPTTDTSYWVRVKGDCGTVDSTTAAVVVCVKPQITGAPANQTGTSGFRAALSVTATGTDLTYRWYKGASGDTSSPLAETGTSLTFTATETADYWVRVSGACGAADSPAAKVSVAPAITSQPAGGWVMPGQTRTLQVAATGLPLSYQWYTKSGTTETTVGGATTNSYTPPPPAVTTNFFCRVISGNASTDSSVATINVCSPPALSWASNITTKVRPSFSQVLSVTGAGVDATTPHTNQWYVKNPDGTWTPAATQETYSIAPPATTTYKVRVTFTSTGCYSEASITISVCVPVITTQPAASTLLDKTTDPAATAQLRVAADLGPHRFQWYIGQPGVTTTPAANGTTDTLTVSPTADTTYWVRVTTVECGVSVDSNAATVVLCKSPAITQQPPTVVTTTAGTAATLSVNASGTTLTYRWYIGSSGDISTPVANATGSTYSPAPTVTTDYWVKVSGQCGSVNSTTSKVSVAPAITTQPASASITSGTSRTLTVAASGTQLTYQWYSVVNGTGTSISGATSTSYTTPALTASASYYVKVISGGAASTQSSTATVTVCQPGTVTWSGSSVSGTTHTLSIVSPVAGETYDWYMGATGNTASYVGTGTSVVVSPTQTTTYWARFKRSTCTADSATVTVTICTPRIVTQPVGETVDPGASRTLSVSATGNPPLTYQWYVGTSGVTTSPVSGATNPTYTTPAVSSTTSYWVRVTSPANCGTYVVDSVTATLTVCRKPTISQQPFSINIEPGTGTTLSVTATGDGLSYQWYEGAVGVTTKPVGTNSRTFTVAPAATTSYWVRVSGTCGTADSTLAKVSIYPVITTHPVGGGVCDVGQNVTLSVAATGSQLVYRWCSRTDTTEWSVLPQTGPQITVAVTSTPMYFQSEVSSGDALRVSDPAGFVLNEKPFIQTINVFRVYTGTYRLEAIVASSDTLPLSYAWYQGPVGNVASSTYLTSTYYVQVSPRPPVTYWVRVTNADTGCYSDRAYSF
ncbi:MAG: hypothetical protein M3Q69_06110 [Acidobacteriota bacterium]|nr:hypothetical protein [Acidobacteriota bacterium]